MLDPINPQCGAQPAGRMDFNQPGRGGSKTWHSSGTHSRCLGRLPCSKRQPPQDKRRLPRDGGRMPGWKRRLPFSKRRSPRVKRQPPGTKRQPPLSKRRLPNVLNRGRNFVSCSKQAFYADSKPETRLRTVGTARCTVRAAQSRNGCQPNQPITIPDENRLLPSTVPPLPPFGHALLHRMEEREGRGGTDRLLPIFSRKWNEIALPANAGSSTILRGRAARAPFQGLGGGGVGGLFGPRRMSLRRRASCLPSSEVLPSAPTMASSLVDALL